MDVDPEPHEGGGTPESDGSYVPSDTESVVDFLVETDVESEVESEDEGEGPLACVSGGGMAAVPVAPAVGGVVSDPPVDPARPPDPPRKHASSWRAVRLGHDDPSAPPSHRAIPRVDSGYPCGPAEGVTDPLQLFQLFFPSAFLKLINERTMGVTVRAASPKGGGIRSLNSRRCVACFPGVPPRSL